MPIHNPLWEIIEPYLIRAGLYSVPDPTYGRWGLPPHPPHLDLINDPAIKHQYHRVFLRPYSSFDTRQAAYESSEILRADDVILEEAKVGPGRWVCYSTWELTTPPASGWEGEGKGRGRDLVLVHGLSDYGLRYAPHVKHFLRAGFRVVIPDLPSFGRSTGVNSYLPSTTLLTSALHAVLTHLVETDVANEREQRKVFLSGSSMGGWTVLYYLLKYPPGSTQAIHPGSKARVSVSGAFVLCPMVEVSKESRPHWITELIGRSLVYFAGTLPLAKALKGKVSDDPRVEEDFYSDPLCYHGWLRVGTGFALLQGMSELQKRAEEINVPIRLIHGSSDRVTSHLGTLRLFDRLPHEDKEIEIYDGYEHVMTKVGIDAADDEKRQRVLHDWREWLLKRC